MIFFLHSFVVVMLSKTPVEMVLNAVAFQFVRDVDSMLANTWWNRWVLKRFKDKYRDNTGTASTSPPPQPQPSLRASRQPSGSVVVPFDNSNDSQEVPTVAKQVSGGDSLERDVEAAMPELPIFSVGVLPARDDDYGWSDLLSWDLQLRLLFRRTSVLQARRRDLVDHYDLSHPCSSFSFMKLVRLFQLCISVLFEALFLLVVMASFVAYLIGCVTCVVAPIYITVCY